jgi:hypothetical protein
MFDYPYLKAKDTDYRKLNITPEASKDEITDAKNDILSFLDAQKLEIEKNLKHIYENVQGLRDVEDEIARLQNSSSSDEAEKYRELLERSTVLEIQAQKIDPRFSEYKKQLAELRAKVSEINNMKLESQEGRNEYDLSIPLHTLLKLSDFEHPVFSDKEKRMVISLIREELADFFEKEKNTGCFHPSDFTRKHFYLDFNYNEYLDGGINVEK